MTSGSQFADNERTRLRARNVAPGSILSPNVRRDNLAIVNDWKRDAAFNDSDESALVQPGTKFTGVAAPL